MRLSLQCVFLVLEQFVQFFPVSVSSSPCVSQIAVLFISEKNLEVESCFLLFKKKTFLFFSMDGRRIQNECPTKKYQLESSQQASKFSIPQV